MSHESDESKPAKSEPRADHEISDEVLPTGEQPAEALHRARAA
jgi:hypothetical protein